jgi:predicted transcriptional regulator
MSNNIDPSKFWEGPDGHRFALEVLQLPLRRRMLRLIAEDAVCTERIERELDLSPALGQYHLAMLEKALVIERTEDGWTATPTGRLYLDKVEAGR